MKQALALSLVVGVTTVATPGCAPDLKPCNELELLDELLFVVTEPAEGYYCDPAELFGLHVGQELRFVIRDINYDQAFVTDCFSAAGPVETDWPWEFSFIQAEKGRPFQGGYSAATGECTGALSLYMALGGFSDTRWHEPIPYEPAPAALGIDFYPIGSSPSCFNTDCYARVTGTLQKVRR